MKRSSDDLTPCYFVAAHSPYAKKGYTELGKVCQGCGEWVRKSRLSIHGMPHGNKKGKVSDSEVEGLTKAAAKMGIYFYGSPFHPSSIILKDLSRYYGQAQRVESGVCQQSRRIRMAGDIYEMRLHRDIGIRMSMTRDTDRFTLTLNSELDRLIRCYWQPSPPSRLSQLQLLFFQVFILRGCLSENSRDMMRHQRTPLLPCNFFARDINSMLWFLTGYSSALLVASGGTLFNGVLQPYSTWCDRGNMYQDLKRNCSPLMEWCVVALHFLSWSLDVFLSPQLFEEHMISIPGFQSFRSKEVWLHKKKTHTSS